MVNVGKTFLYCILSCLQMYILMGVGIVSYYKKILNSKNCVFIPKILMNFLIPVYVIVKLSEGVTIELLNTYWVLVINFIVQLVVGYAVSIVFHCLLKMDVRTKQCFGSMCMIPAIGALPLVIARGFCFPDGPVDGDPLCNDFLAILMTCMLIFNFSVYVISYILFNIDKSVFEEITEKISHLWHHVLNKYNKRNVTAEIFLIKYTDGKYEDYFKEFEAKYTPLPTKEDEVKEYYEKLFELIEQHLNQKKKHEYLEAKKIVMSRLCSTPITLPVTKSFTINQEMYDYIRAEWKEKEKELKASYPNLQIQSVPFKINPQIVLKQVITPAVISILFGMILSISGIRNIIFNKNNVYWTNFMDGFLTITQSYTPILFGLMGLATVTAKTDISELMATKTHVAVLLIIRFLIMPFLGMFNVYMWKRYYGGIVKQSPAYRLLMFSHWCLPSPSNMTLIVNLTNYFGNEYGYLILISNLFCFVGLSILNLIYFVIDDLD